MSLATNDHIDLLGPPLAEQCADDVARMEKHGVIILSEAAKRSETQQPTGRRSEDAF
jgi:hypothetical protein